jgi:hypothetical protein
MAPHPPTVSKHFKYTSPQLTKDTPTHYWKCWWFLGCPVCGPRKYNSDEERRRAVFQHSRHGVLTRWTVELPEPYPEN